MAGRNMRSLSVAIAFITCIVAGYCYDWILVGVECVFFVAVCYAFKERNAEFGSAFHVTAIVTSVALIAVLLVNESGTMDSYLYRDIEWIYIIECLLIPVLSFDVGFMLAVMFDKYTESRFSKRWIIVFALVFSLAVSGIAMFTVGFSILYEGMPFFRDEALVSDHHTDRLLMVAPDAAVVSAVASAIAAKILTKGIDRSVLLTEVSQ